MATVSNAAPDKPVTWIPGLIYIDRFLEPAAAQALLEKAAEGPWDASSLTRKTRQFGWTYDYRDRRAPLKRAAAFPDSIQGLHDKLTRHPVVRKTFAASTLRPAFQQVIVNHYAPGQGIAPHVDHPIHFGPIIAIVSTGHPVPMVFTQQVSPHCTKTVTPRSMTLVLQPGSLVLLTGPARWGWSHTILARRSDGGRPRKPRISFTFRMVKELGDAYGDG